MTGANGVSVGTRIVRRTAQGPLRKVEADICVVGAGIAGVSAAIEAARLGRKVVLVDGLPALGGQAVNSIIGTFCGLFSNGTHGYQFTHGIADDILDTLGKNSDQLYYRNGPLTTVVYYDEIALGRWIDRAVQAAGITTIVGAVLREVRVDGRRIQSLGLATRYGDVEVDGDRLCRCHRRRGARLAGGLCLPGAGERAGLRHPDGDPGKHRRGQAADPRRDRRADEAEGRRLRAGPPRGPRLHHSRDAAWRR